MGDRVVSTELVLISAENVYSFLGGTDSAHFEMRPNDLLKFEIMRWAKTAGKKNFVLGGGYTPNDGVFRYKQAFAPQGVVPFYVGQRILDPQSFERLVAERRRTAPYAGESMDFFPAYRAA
jgi:lipid II:glycine glycyltransferase (peptidoglycan interpeptide bridge formation enzyme)